MKPRIRYQHWYFTLPWARDYAGIVLYPWILFREEKGQVSDELFRHELEHVYQISRTGVLRFYVRWLIYTCKHGYFNNPFEVEARARSREPLTPYEKHLKEAS
jgi:hypothetical protein